MSQYKHQAKPMKVAGIWYSSQLEGRLALLLLKHKIPFKPHVSYDVVDRQGKPFTYTVDFLLYRPIKFLGISFAVEALETKGVLRKHDLLRNEALKYCHGIRCYIVLDALLAMWETEGIT